MKKKIQWLIAIVLCIGISLIQLYAPGKVKERMHQIVYSSDDILYIRGQTYPYQETRNSFDMGRAQVIFLH